MKGKDAPDSRVRYLELAAVDLSITALQVAGYGADDRATSGNPHEIMAQAVADLHHPLVELSGRDREIIPPIKELASQLSGGTSLPKLLEARGKI